MRLEKPSWVFGREREWQGLAAFATDPWPNATLGVVRGRQRHGKSFLLQALAEQTGGLYFGATEATEAESLRLFADALVRHTREPLDQPFRDWNDAIRYLLSQITGDPTLVVLDEFPFLSRVSPALPSILQRELGPGGAGSNSSARLVLCGSAMSVMGGLLSGQAPLRGRAGLDDFDAWVCRTVLDPQTPLFREARYLLAEETDIREPALYHSVLAAIATGNTTNGGIASYIGRRSDELAHPLTVLEDAALIVREPDLFRSGRATYRITEPLITFYEAVMRRRWPELELGLADAVWAATQRSFSSQVMGPHFEAICRSFATLSGASLFGELPTEVGHSAVNDAADRAQIEVDVAVLGDSEPGGPKRILSLGEAKWGEVMGLRHLAKLARARDLLAVKKYDTRATVFACYSAAGFDDELRSRAAEEPEHIRLIGLEELYAAR